MKTATTLNKLSGVLGVLLLAVLASPCLSSLPATNVSESGNEFLTQCRFIAETPDNKITQEQFKTVIECYAYSSGVLEGLIYGNQWNIEYNTPRMFDLPSDGKTFDITVGQAMRIALKYIADHPEAAHQKTFILFADALREAFPPKQLDKEKQ